MYVYGSSQVSQILILYTNRPIRIWVNEVEYTGIFNIHAKIDLTVQI